MSDQTVGNILRRHGIPLVRDRKKTTTWKEFIRTHREVLVATDFFTTEVWTKGGLVTFYVLFFLYLASCKVHVVGVTPSPHQECVNKSGEGKMPALEKPQHNRGQLAAKSAAPPGR
jgi:putative transposase